MAEPTTNTAPQGGARKPKNKQHLSRPVFKQKLKLNSLQAQRVMHRSWERGSHALFSLDVILRIIGDDNEVAAVEELIVGIIDKASQDMDSFREQLRKLMVDNGIDQTPGYSNPEEYSIEITSPLVTQFARLVMGLDEIMALVDTLWLNSIFNGKQRKDATYEWQQRIINIAGKMIGYEKRARIACYAKGKKDEVDEAAPEKELSEIDPELEAAAAEDAEEVKKSSAA